MASLAPVTSALTPVSPTTGEYVPEQQVQEKPGYSSAFAQDIAITPTRVGAAPPAGTDPSELFYSTGNEPEFTSPQIRISAGASEQGLVVTSASAVGLTPPDGAIWAQITVEGGAVRYRDDGTAPTVALGSLVAAGTTFRYDGPLSAVKFIAVSTAATISVAYYR